MRKSFLTTRLFSSSFCCHENGRDRDPDDAVQRRRFKRRVSSSFQDLQTTPVGWWVVLAVAGGLLYGYNVRCTRILLLPLPRAFTDHCLRSSLPLTPWIL